MYRFGKFLKGYNEEPYALVVQVRFCEGLHQLKIYWRYLADGFYSTLLTLDIIKEKLAEAYKMTYEAKMANEISEIMDICKASKNNRLRWFKRLLDNHFEGIIAHATYDISQEK